MIYLAFERPRAAWSGSCSVAAGADGLFLQFHYRPVATTLLAIGLFLGGGLAYQFLPVELDRPLSIFRPIVVFASRPGVVPETISTCRRPLERRLGEIGGSQRDRRHFFDRLQHDHDPVRSWTRIDSAAATYGGEPCRVCRSAVRPPIRPFYRKFNPAEALVMEMALSSSTLSTAKIYDAADNILVQAPVARRRSGQVLINRRRIEPGRSGCGFIDECRLAAAGLSGQDAV